MVEPVPLLSRVAESVHWMARYIERAENVARFIGVNLRLLDMPLEPTQQWQPLIDTSGDVELFGKRYGEATRANVIQFLAMDGENPSSIYSCLRAARENARSVRETISSEMWEQINGMYLNFMPPQGALRRKDTLSEILQAVRMGCHLFQGIADSTMSRNEAWHFMRLGGSLERADKISRILDVKYFILLPSPTVVGTPYDDLHWAAVLKSVSGFEMYRKKFGGITPGNIVDFLVLDREFPRAIHHCICQSDDWLHAITGTPVGTYRCRSEQLLGLLRAELDFTPVESVIHGGLHQYLDALQVKLNGVGDSLFGDFFGWSSPNGAQSYAVGTSG